MISNNKYLTQGEMESNAKEIYIYLSDKGWTINAISGLLGNMQRESTINPGLWQSLKEGNYSGGYGLVQWTPATKYTNWAKANGYDIGDGTVPSAFNCNAAIAAVGVLQSPATINIGDVKVGKSGFINGNGNPRLVTFSRKYSLFFTTPLIICL